MSIYQAIDSFYGQQVARIEAAFERDIHAGKGDEAAFEAYRHAMRLAWHLRRNRMEAASKRINQAG